MINLSSDNHLCEGGTGDGLGGFCQSFTTGTIFDLIQDMIGTNLLPKFHKDLTINVASRVLTRKLSLQKCKQTNILTKFHEDWTKNVYSRVLTRKNAPPLRAMFFNQLEPFQHIQDIIGTNLLTKFHEDRTINVAS
ncbi:hypothetical protein DPMN_004399 [Dreissena polymorpha]|uniref:Uncharacterized protein n=1 Tax=Dreissena polymorpha TaxID=45954 RepID=A0A9D4RVK8_DREPO|nr:hypothetical protein DPMN_004399 [Dreissena polymorpha]